MVGVCGEICFLLQETKPVLTLKGKNCNLARLKICSPLSFRDYKYESIRLPQIVYNLYYSYTNYNDDHCNLLPQLLHLYNWTTSNFFFLFPFFTNFLELQCRQYSASFSVPMLTAFDVSVEASSCPFPPHFPINSAILLIHLFI